MSTQHVNHTLPPVPLPFTEADVIVMAVLICILFVIGVIGNSLLMIVLVQSKQLKSMFNLLIFSLCVSDLVSALISWVNLYRRTWGYNHFEMPSIICTLFWGIHIWTSYVSSLHILTFASLRFVAVLSYEKFQAVRLKYVQVWICVMWAITLAGAIPLARFSGVEFKDRHAHNPDSRWPVCAQYLAWLQPYRLYTISVYPIFFYIPILLTIIFSIAIAIILGRRRSAVSKCISTQGMTKRIKKENQAIGQLAVVVTSFLIGYLPFTAFEFYTINHKGITEYDFELDWAFGTGQYICLRISECLNPFLYTICSSDLRDATVALFKKCFCPCWREKSRADPITINVNTVESDMHIRTVTKAR